MLRPRYLDFNLPNPTPSAWKYMRFEHFKDMLETESLYFAHADQFPDSGEGLMPHDLFEAQLSRVQSDQEREVIRNNRLRFQHYMRKKALICSWTLRNIESVKGWNRFEGCANVVAIHAPNTREFLRTSMTIGVHRPNTGSEYPSDIWTRFIDWGVVKYDYGDEDGGLPERLFFYKDRRFSWERELRFHCIPSFDSEDNDFSTTHGRHVECKALRKAVKSVYVHPCATSSLFDDVARLVRRYGFPWQVSRSSLANRLSPPK